MRYQRTLEDPITTELELHRNQKGYNIQLDGKFYFPRLNNPVINNLEKYEHQELWVVIEEDKVNYGTIAFAVPDYFIIPDYDKKEVRIEKEIPLNFLDEIEETYKWDYDIIAKVNNPDQTEKFIDELEAQGCPDRLIKEALNEFYALIK